mmetsp:Transcript_902/g.1105  ORF Transcript_902/g.1105 Transcript_902/m.1105 type:complete len:166 (-) Transcript_902:846-1343(-)|eukprot:CAMPEP_0170508780 /NCGR_PEP_ID=MMETSP0208-20121228/63406_1 /TAXON_ID=197538 /ORGANISM="Strombidium inclinatum, Strain S3" /LENGTH=165 /DNA_ID=CAMNT_0010791877 /DNA_START=3122 /DNA_END=3619 /DNA_ORIENTATION=-
MPSNLTDESTLPFTQFTFFAKELQEMKLASQLRAIFSPKLKTHVSVLAEMIDKIHHLKSSEKLVSTILALAEMCLSTTFLSKEDLEAEKIGAYRERIIRTSLENQIQNISCLQEVVYEIEDIFERNEPRYGVPRDDGTFSSRQPPNMRMEFICDDFQDVLPSEKI